MHQTGGARVGARVEQRPRRQSITCGWGGREAVLGCCVHGGARRKRGAVSSGQSVSQETPGNFRVTL